MSRTKPITIVMPAKTVADKKRIAEFEEAMSRQVGFKVVMEPIKDKSGNESRIVGWPMSRSDQAAVAMFMRRGKKPNNPALLTTADVHEKRPVQILIEKELTKK
jgi:hypothetical protein